MERPAHSGAEEVPVKLIIGNRTYSSWSLRGWLACRQSGLAFTTEVVPLFGPDWDHVRRTHPGLSPSDGRVPVLWDETEAGEPLVVWDSLAILDHLADRVGRDRFWPRDPAASALARAMVAEMHSGFGALRSALPMNLRRHADPVPLGPAVEADLLRIVGLWAEARARFGQGGPFLFGPFGAADIAFAPVVGRCRSYEVPLTGFAATYAEALWEHPWLVEWCADAAAEPWHVAQYDLPSGRAA